VAWAAFLTIMRPINCAMMGLAVIVGGVIASGTLQAGNPLLLGFSTGFLLAGVINILNDINDLEVDRINRPERPLPSGALKVAAAAIWASLLLLLGLATAALTSPLCLIIAALASLLGGLYNRFIKRTGLLGNIVVALIVAIPFLYGWLAFGGNGGPLLWLFSLMAFCAILGREILKGIADVEGDARRGIRTIAVTKGLPPAALAAIGLFLLAVILSFLPPLLGLVYLAYLPPVMATDVGFLYSSARIWGDPSPRMAYVEKKRVLVWMTLALLAFLVGGVHIFV
jgi:geranylgeranylglycerol-phosphate geranylgeranyltransferase